MAEADVRSGGLNQETVDDFKEMDRKIVPDYVCNPERSGFKAWKTDRQSLRPKNRCRQICCVLESDAASEHEPANMNKAKGIAKREEKTGMEYAKNINKDAQILALKSIVLETTFGEAGVFRGTSFRTYADLRASPMRYFDDKVPVSQMKAS